MHHRPLLDQAQSPARQLALADIESAEVDGRFELTVSGVEVWGRVIIEEHSDQDPIECADGRHPATPIVSTHVDDASRHIRELTGSRGLPPHSTFAQTNVSTSIPYRR